MATYTYAIEVSDDSKTWMPPPDGTGTETFAGTAQDYARLVLSSYLDDTGDPGPVRVVVWNGTRQDVIDMAAATIYG